MKRPKIRIGTLMFLVVIVALTVALVLERQRSARLMVEAEARQAEAEVRQAEAHNQAERARYAEQLARAALASQVEKAKLEAGSAGDATGVKPR
jgi:hypothetical protein